MRSRYLGFKVLSLGFCGVPTLWDRFFGVPVEGMLRPMPAEKQTYMRERIKDSKFLEFHLLSG